jgi:Cu/Ag efflux protein CusF
MGRAAVILFCAAAAVSSALPGPTAAQIPRVEAKPVTVTATIEAIDKDARVVTLKGPKGQSVDVKAPDAMEGFNTLRVGDQVSATYYEAIALQVRRPGDPARSQAPETTVRRQELKPGSETRRQQTVTATVDTVDGASSIVTVKRSDGRALTIPVADPTQLQNLKSGDTVDVTYYESLFVKVARPKKN